MYRCYFILLALSFVILPQLFISQVGINTTQPDPSSVLDMKSNEKGFLMPRMNTEERLRILNPEQGLMVYDTDLKKHLVFSNGEWREQRQEISFSDGYYFIATYDGNIATPSGTNTQKFEPVSVPFALYQKSAVPANCPDICTEDCREECVENRISGLPNGNVVINADGLYLVKFGGGFRKNPANGSNMLVRVIFLVNDVIASSSWIQLPNNTTSSSSTINFGVFNLKSTDVVKLQVKKDQFTETVPGYNMTNLYGDFSELFLKLELLPTPK